MSKTLTQRIQEVLEKLDPMIRENVWTPWIFIKIVNPSSDCRRPLGAARRAVGSWEVKASHFIRM